MEKTSNLNIRIDDELKKEADTLFKDLGLNISTAINIFLKQAVRKQAIPFDVSKDTPNKQTLKALKEANDILNSKKKKTYENMDEVYKDLGL